MSNGHLENVSKIEPAEAVLAEQDPSVDQAEPSTNESAAKSAPTPETPTSDSSERSGLPAWLFLVTLLLFAGVVGWQFQIKGQLDAQIAGLQSELRDTQSLLGAHKSRLGEIRSGVRSLSDQLGGLLTLVEADPSEGVALESAESGGGSTEPLIDTTPTPRPEIPARLAR